MTATYPGIMSGTERRRKHSPAVYRRRRIVLFVALLAIVAVVWLLIAQPWRGSAKENARSSTGQTQDAATSLPAPTPGASGGTGGTPPPEGTTVDPSTASGAPACTKNDVTVEAVTDSDAYGSGQNPQLSIRLTNTGKTDCSLNVGTSAQVFTIMSGEDTWWRSTDCQSESSDMVVLLAAGQTVSSAAPVSWDRTRSAVGTCGDAARDAAPGGGASYNLSVQIAGIGSTQSAPFLLY